MQFKKMLERCDPVMFHRLELGNFELSVQASRTHYCTPRETLPSAEDYFEFEVGLFENGRWVNPTLDERFNPVIAYLRKHWEDGPTGVGAYVPSEIIQTLYEFVQDMPQATESTEQTQSE